MHRMRQRIDALQLKSAESSEDAARLLRMYEDASAREEAVRKTAEAHAQQIDDLKAEIAARRSRMHESPASGDADEGSVESLQGTLRLVRDEMKLMEEERNRALEAAAAAVREQARLQQLSDDVQAREAEQAASVHAASIAQAMEVQRIIAQAKSTFSSRLSAAAAEKTALLAEVERLKGEMEEERARELQ
eukprot:4467218-Pleurochrysis_carterae.AAC.1